MGLILKQRRLQTAKSADEGEKEQITIWIFDHGVVSLPSLLSEKKEMVAGCCKQYHRKPRKAAGLSRLLNYWGLAEPPWKAPKKHVFFSWSEYRMTNQPPFKWDKSKKLLLVCEKQLPQCGCCNVDSFLMKRRAKNDTKSFSLLQTGCGHHLDEHRGASQLATWSSVARRTNKKPHAVSS